MISCSAKPANIRRQSKLSTQRTKGPDALKSLNNITLAQIHPAVPGITNLNCCGDPDCGNYGIAPDVVKHTFLGRNADERRRIPAMNDPAISAGLGRYKIDSESRKELLRQTDAFAFSGDPIAWNDGRVLICQHSRGNSDCGIQFNVLSNEHFEDELSRLVNHNGVLEAPGADAAAGDTLMPRKSSSSTAPTASPANDRGRLARRRGRLA